MDWLATVRGVVLIVGRHRVLWLRVALRHPIGTDILRAPMPTALSEGARITVRAIPSRLALGLTCPLQVRLLHRLAVAVSAAVVAVLAVDTL